MSVNDIELFVDYAVYPHERGGVQVMNKIDGTTRTFHDLTSAVDYAAAKSCTISPRFPAGYRSRPVRMLEAMGVTLASQLRDIEGESVDIDDSPGPQEVAEKDPIAECRGHARALLRQALEALTEAEEAVWVERARDMYDEAQRLEERRKDAARARDRENDNAGGFDPWQRVTGRAGRLDRRE